MQKTASKMVEKGPQIAKKAAKAGTNSPYGRISSEKLAGKKAVETDLPKYVIVEKGRWYVRRQFPKFDGSGLSAIKRKCKEHTQFEVDRLVAQIEAEIEELKRPEAIVETSTVEDFFEEYLESKKGAWQDLTCEKRFGLFKRHIKGTVFGSQSLSDIKGRSQSKDDPTSLQTFYNYLQNEKGRTANTVREIHQNLLSGGFNDAFNNGWIDRNPCRTVSLPKGQKKEMVVMDEKEVKAIRDACMTDLDFVVFHVALATWARPQEYLALAWSDIDFKDCRITIRRAVVHLEGGGFKIKQTKTDGSKRILKISTTLRDRLLELKKRHDAWKIKLRKRRRKGANEVLENIAKYDLVFSTKHGTPHNRLNLSTYQFPKLVELSGIGKRLTLYSFRHTGATLALEKGANIKAVAEQMGHTNVTHVLTTYVHVSKNIRDQIMDVMAGILGE